MSRRILHSVLLALTCLVLILGWNRTTTAQEKPFKYLHNAWDTEHGLPQNDVTQLIQTRDGYLWLGTNGGLVRFDGIRGTYGGGLNRFKDGRFIAITTKNGMFDNIVSRILRRRSRQLLDER